MRGLLAILLSGGWRVFSALARFNLFKSRVFGDIAEWCHRKARTLTEGDRQ